MNLKVLKQCRSISLCMYGLNVLTFT